MNCILSLCVSPGLGYDALKNISKLLVESTQTGELGSNLNLTIDVISVSEPVKDPELVIFNINETGKKTLIKYIYKTFMIANDQPCFFILFFVIL